MRLWFGNHKRPKFQDPKTKVEEIKFHKNNISMEKNDDLCGRLSTLRWMDNFI